MIHVAAQTISWGSEPDVPQMLRDIKEAGYAGIELAQHPSYLPPVSDLHALMKELRLKLVGVAGGSLGEKLELIRSVIAADYHDRMATVSKSGAPWQVTQDPDRQPPYVYLDYWNDAFAAELHTSDATFAIHPHMFKPVQTVSEAEALLQRHPRLRLLPDTAHLTVAGEDVCKTIDRHFDRLAAVHLKDWSAVYGRAYQFYSRGFTDLGEGDVKLDAALDLLKQRSFSGWVVVERDEGPTPARNAGKSRVWLRTRHGI